MKNRGRIGGDRHDTFRTRDQKHIGKEIIIDPFDEKNLNPNSYNLRLHNELLVYDEPVLDMKKPNKTKSLSFQRKVWF